MEDSVCASVLSDERHLSGDVGVRHQGRANLIGALLDEFLEAAIRRVSEGQEDALFERAERTHDPRLANLAPLADKAVAALDEQLTASGEDALECVRSLDRARKLDPALRELLALENWETYFRASVSPLKILTQLTERSSNSSSSSSSTTSSPSNEDQERDVIARAQTAVLLTSITSQLKTHLEDVFRREPLLAWMSEW